MTTRQIPTFGWRTTTLRAGQAGRMMTFISQFLPIYLADMARAWMDHLLRDTFDNWEDLKEIFTGNF
jgi:hypothetical protein